MKLLLFQCFCYISEIEANKNQKWFDEILTQCAQTVDGVGRVPSNNWEIPVNTHKCLNWNQWFHCCCCCLSIPFSVVYTVANGASSHPHNHSHFVRNEFIQIKQIPRHAEKGRGRERENYDYCQQLMRIHERARASALEPVLLIVVTIGIDMEFLWGRTKVQSILGSQTEI